MKISLKILGCIAALLLVSCAKDETILYNEMALGQFEGESVSTDNGDTYYIVENTMKDEDLKDYLGKRVCVVCDLLRQCEEKGYEIRLKNLIPVLCKDAVQEITEEMGNDPIEIINGWLSDKYVNLRFGYTYCVRSETKHFVNLAVEGISPADSPEKPDTLNLRLLHNGYGEVFGVTGNQSLIQSNSYTVQYAAGYASFPIESVVPEGMKGGVMRFRWNWYITMAGSMLENNEPRQGLLKF